MQYYEYLESDGNCYVDTGVSAQIPDHVKLKFAWKYGNSNYNAPFGSYGVYSTGIGSFCMYSYGNNTVVRIGGPQNEVTIISNPPENQPYVVEIYKDGRCFVDSVPVGTIATVGDVYDYHSCIFAAMNQGIVRNYAKCRVYEVIAYDAQDEEIYHLYPANDGTAYGFKDTVRDVFLSKEGSGTLTPGQEVDPPAPPTPPPPPPPAGQFLVQIQRNNSENEHVTKNVDTISECYGVLRDDCSLTDPVILFEIPLTSFVDANYMTIPVFGRSYFIRDVNAISAQLTEVYAHVDVLSSFADEIKANTGIVRRQANDWNLYLNDSVIRCYQNPIVETRLFPHGFENSSYVLLLAGRRNVGVDTGQGGMISGDGIEGGGAGNVNSKTTSGLVKYAAAQVGKPYWYGTFGNEASADLLAIKRNQYSDMYDISVVGGTPFEDQYGQRVHDCVGLIKGYRWRENATGAEPVYRLAEDVNVQGLYAQCTRKKGTVTDPNGALVPVGAVLFYANMQHCGVHIGAGSVIEARGHRYGVVITSLATRPDFTLWGIPDWLQQV